MVDLVGIDAVKQVIKAAKFHQFVIHETRPTFKDGLCNSPNIWDATNADNQDDAALKFQLWAETVLNSNPNNHKIYYLHLGIFKQEGTTGAATRYNPTICAFVLQGHLNPAQQVPYIQSAMSSPAGGRAVSDSEPNAPAQFSNHTNEHYKLMLELERAKWENDQLRASILQDDNEDDDDDDDEDEDIIDQFFGSDEAPGTNPIKEALGKIVLNFAEQMTAAKPEQEVIKAFDKIKTAAPDAGKLLIKLGEIADQNPAQIQEFITQILTTLNSSNDGTEKEN